jgi:hypothetical protein
MDREAAATVSVRAQHGVRQQNLIDGAVLDLAGCREDAVEFGLFVADQDHMDVRSITDAPESGDK